MKLLAAIVPLLLWHGAAFAHPEHIEPIGTEVTADSHREIEELVYRFNESYDTQNYEALLTYLTEDAHYSSPYRGDLRGHAAIAEAMDARPEGRLTRHVITNLIIEVSDDGTAEAHCIVTAYINHDGFGSDGPVPQTAEPALADYSFRFRRENGRWLISEKITRSIFEGRRP